jgi:RsiW-degrading membrane proteinase PrsW (M82 family)
MLKILIFILLALAPCLLWLWIIYKRDKYAPEPLILVIRTFAIGAGVVLPVALIEYFLLPASLKENLTLGSVAYRSFIVAGVTEEAAKYLAVRFSMYRSVFFEEPADGLIYSAAAALGFAALENVLYIFSYGWQTVLLRGITSNLAHVLFACFWGYPLVLTKLGYLKNKAWVGLGWLAAVLAHGLFDFLLMMGNLYSLLTLPFFMAMIGIFILMFRHANQISPYRQPVTRL